MNYFYPRFPLSRLPGMLKIAVAGALVAGTYGAVHDQISYSISPEYFTRMKFQQFSWADFGWPPRAFASVVGFLATWWVGLFAGWILARVGLDQMPQPPRRRCLVRAFSLVLGATAAFGAGGALIGWLITMSDLSPWEFWRDRLNLDDLRGFVIVAWLHSAGYAGALVGLIAAGFYVRRVRRRLEIEP